MFWGYTPALDLLREYFWWRDKPPSCGADKVEAHNVEAGGAGLTITEISDQDGPGTEQEGWEGHVQEDDPPDDGGGRVVNELLLPGARRNAEEPQQAAAARVRGQDGDSRDAGEPRLGAGGQPGPVPLQDGAHRGGHVHLDGAVVVQPSDGGAQHERDHAVRAEHAQGLLQAPLPAQDGPRDPARPQEVTATPFGRAGASGDPFGLFRMDPKVDESAGSEDTLDILLVGGMDCRHVLKTLSRLHHHADALGDRDDEYGAAGPGTNRGRGRRRKVRFFVAETVMELVARQLLFILAALEPPDRLGRTEKVRLLLELLGNSLVRPTTALWLRNASRLLVDLVTDDVALRTRLPVVDLSQLRHRDRDRLEEVLAFYQDRPQNFRIGFHWDQRLRRALGVRYDTRAGAFDWDYYMALRDMPGGDRVCVHEYRHWRETGVAFTWLETEQSEPNLTLAAGIFREGCHLMHGGYLGDIVTSPFIAYSIELEPEDSAEVFRKANDRYVSRSTDAAEKHLNRITHELQYQQKYQPQEDTTSVGGGLVLTRVTDRSRLDPKAPPDDDDPTLRRVRRASDMTGYAPLPVEGAQVVFLSPRFLQAPQESRDRFAGRFHVAVLGLGLGERHMNAELRAVLAPKAVVLVEGSRFLLQRGDARRQAAEGLMQRARDAGLAPLQDFDPDKDDFAKFVVDAG